MPITRITDPLYFIAIVPHEETRALIQSFKLDISERFSSKAALNSPPHITLHMPFRLPDKKFPRLETILTKIAEGTSDFIIQLKNFGCFPPRVIFVSVLENEELEILQRNVLKDMKKLNLFNGNYKDRPFHPHITIGFRDLRPTFFKKAWDEYKDLQLDLSFKVSHITLLKHNGKSWDIKKEFLLSTN